MSQNKKKPIHQLQINIPENREEENSRLETNDFEIQEEYHDKKKVKLQDRSLRKSRPTSTKVMIVDDEANFEISPHKLEEIIHKNKRIRKIIIEEIKVDDVNRVHLLFDRNKGKRLSLAANGKKDNTDLKNDLKSFSKEFNNRLVEKSAHQEGQIVDPAPLPRERERVKKIDLLSMENKLKKSQDSDAASVLKQDNEYEEEDSKESIFDPSELEDLEEVHTYQEKENSTEIKQKKKKIKLSLKAAAENIDLQDIMSQKRNETEKKKTNKESVLKKSHVEKGLETELSDIEINKFLLTRKKTAVREMAKNYYRAKVHLELFRLGKSFYEDYENGVTNFSFISTGSMPGQQKTILGILYFLSYHAAIIPTIITNSIEDSEYFKMLDKISIETMILGEEEISLKYYDLNGVRFIEYKDIETSMTELDHLGPEDLIELIQNQSEMTIWDLPEIKTLGKKSQTFFPIINKLENVSLIVKVSQDKYKEIQELKEYFSKYHIPIKGLIVNEDK